MNDTGPRAAALLLVALTAWAALVVAAPRLVDASSPGLRLTAAATYAAGALVCHQQPGRSFASGGHPWPVCARCSGIYLSAAIVTLGLCALPALRLPSPTSGRWRTALVAAALPTAATWALERAGLLATTNVVRCVLALPLGTAVAVALVAVRRDGASAEPEVN